MTFKPGPLQKIAPDVKIGDGASINDFVYFDGCTIGADTKIGPFVEIQKNATVGARCKIASHTFIGEGVTIEDEVFVGHGVVFIDDPISRATANGALQTGSNSSANKTLVKAGASIGSGALIMCDLTIGARAIVGAGAFVVEDVPDDAVVVGNPSRVLYPSADRS